MLLSPFASYGSGRRGYDYRFCSVHAAAERWKELATYHNVDNGSCDEMSGELEALEIKMYVIFRWE